MAKSNMKAAPKKARKISPSVIGETTKQTSVTDVVDRQHLIAEAAYFIAEQRGFSVGDELDDWLQAEQAVDALLTI